MTFYEILCLNLMFWFILGTKDTNFLYICFFSTQCILYSFKEINYEGLEIFLQKVSNRFFTLAVREFFKELVTVLKRIDKFEGVFISHFSKLRKKWE